MKTVWTAQELKEAYDKRGSKPFVLRTNDGKFYDLNDRLLTKMQDYYAIYETEHEVQVSRAKGPAPTSVKQKSGFVLGEILHT